MGSTSRLLRLAVLLWLIVPGAGCVDSRGARARPEVEPPQTPAGRALAAWLRAYHLDNIDSTAAFARRSYSVDELAQRSAEVIARGLRLWFMNYGELRLVTIDSSAPYALEATVHEGLTDAYGTIFVEVDSAPPHPIAGVWLIPFSASGPTAARRRRRFAFADSLDRFAMRLARHDVFSGAIAVGARDGQPAFVKAYGMADRAGGLPNTPDSQFELASLSKLFTVVAIAQLVERGQISFDATVADVLPDYPDVPAGRRITLHHLLTHTSGLPDYYRNGKLRLYEASLRTLRDYWKTFAFDSLWSEPGTGYDYSNSNYILLGSIVERVSGLSFEEYVHRNVFEPAGMASTCYCEPGAPEHARPYSRHTAGFGPERAPVIDRWQEVPPGAYRPAAPAGGGFSTVGDLLRFAQALVDNRLLSAHMTEVVTRPRVGMGDGGRRAYGFEVYEISGMRIVGHGGNFWGTMSQIDIYAEGGHTVVVLSNNDASGGPAIRDWTRRVLTGGEAVIGR